MTQLELFTGQENIAIHDLPYGKMCQEHLAPTKAMTLQKWLGHYLGVETLTPPKTAGATRALRWAMTDLPSGGLWMLNTSDWPKDASVCLLSQILEIGRVDPQYYLSQRACQGIIHRAEKRGKTIPSMLKMALEKFAMG